MPDPAQVRSMFGRIAGRYDLLNRVLSAGIDRRWRRRLLAAAGEVGGRVVVDACCGTGDVSWLFAAHGATVVGVDFTPEMLRRARAKRGRGVARFVLGDALRLPLGDRSADVATIAFGIRNVEDRGRGLRELARVVRPGGSVLVLECSVPRGPWLGSAYRFYFRRILPAVGGLVSGDGGAYRYLPETVLAWPTPEEFAQEMRRSGLEGCGFEMLSGGIAVLFHGRVPAPSASP